MCHYYLIKGRVRTTWTETEGGCIYKTPTSSFIFNQLFIHWIVIRTLPQMQTKQQQSGPQ
jgi:hypothetical protein